MSVTQVLCLMMVILILYFSLAFSIFLSMARCFVCDRQIETGTVTGTKKEKNKNKKRRSR